MVQRRRELCKKRRKNCKKSQKRIPFFSTALFSRTKNAQQYFTHNRIERKKKNERKNSTAKK
jgi:hypothetical protein